MKTDPRIIDVDDSRQDDDRPQETPVFSIESTPDGDEGSDGPKKSSGGMGCGYWILLFLVVAAAVWFVAIRGKGGEGAPGIHSSVSDKDNLKHLSEHVAAPGAAGTQPTSDSVLGVGFDMYSLKGLRATLETKLPDTADRTLVLFMRSADYHADGSPLGTMVLDGKKIDSKESDARRAYAALSAEGTIAIGISDKDKMASKVKDKGGSFFRQYPLLGDGELPRDFSLHGKVERAAIARMADGELYYVVTRHRETMYDFADAMREYGFTDAIYMTGGNSYDFHRTPDGAAHVSPRVREKIEKYSSTPLKAPLLVFRTAIPTP